MIKQNEIMEGPRPDDFLSLELRKRELGGYLGEDVPDMLIKLPPPPYEGSSGWENDLELSFTYLRADEARKEQAKQDAILRFPWATDAFNSVVDGKIHPEISPSLYKILKKTCQDGIKSTRGPKQFYERPRPFMVNHLPTLTPQDEDILKEDGSYPSGHTAVGWIWALILVDLFPFYSYEVLERGRQFGISRNICNVHWHSDVLAGRTCGAAVTSRLYECPEFLDDLHTAKRELAAMEF